MIKEKGKKLNVKVILILLGSLFTFHFSLITPQALAQDESTSSSIRDLVREKVKEKLDTLTALQPQAVIGTTQKISDRSLEIKTVDEKIQLVATSDETKIFRITKGKRSEIKFADLALDENIIAMGYKNSQSVLEGKRIITSDEPPLGNNKQTAYGKVSVLGKNTLTVKHPQTGEERSIKVSSKTDITGKGDDGSIADITFAEIKIEDGVVVVGTPDNNGLLTATRVHAIPTTPTP